MKNSCEKILNHKWLDPECVETGCQSLTLKQRTENAEELAEKFKWQVRDTCARAEKAEQERDAALRGQIRATLGSCSCGRQYFIPGKTDGRAADERDAEIASLTARAEAAERELACRDALIKDHLRTIMQKENRIDELDFYLSDARKSGEGLAQMLVDREQLAEKHHAELTASRDSLSALLQEARETLEPFNAFAEEVARQNPGWDHDGFQVNELMTLAPFRRARSICEQIDAARIGDGEAS